MKSKIYVVSFLIDNPPKKGDWEWVDESVRELTGVTTHGDFSDGCTASYYIKDKSEAEELFNKLKDISVIGSTKKFKISDVCLKK